MVNKIEFHEPDADLERLQQAVNDAAGFIQGRSDDASKGPRQQRLGRLGGALAFIFGAWLLGLLSVPVVQLAVLAACLVAGSSGLSLYRGLPTARNLKMAQDERELNELEARLRHAKLSGASADTIQLLEQAYAVKILQMGTGGSISYSVRSNNQDVAIHANHVEIRAIRPPKDVPALSKSASDAEPT